MLTIGVNLICKLVVTFWGVSKIILFWLTVVDSNVESGKSISVRELCQKVVTFSELSWRVSTFSANDSSKTSNILWTERVFVDMKRFFRRWTMPRTVRHGDLRWKSTRNTGQSVVIPKEVSTLRRVALVFSITAKQAPGVTVALAGLTPMISNWTTIYLFHGFPVFPSWRNRSLRDYSLNCTSCKSVSSTPRGRAKIEKSEKKRELHGRDLYELNALCVSDMMRRSFLLWADDFTVPTICRRIQLRLWPMSCIDRASKMSTSRRCCIQNVSFQTWNSNCMISAFARMARWHSFHDCHWA
jgi:hypothetical protein